MCWLLSCSFPLCVCGWILCEARTLNMNPTIILNVPHLLVELSFGMHSLSLSRLLYIIIQSVNYIYFNLSVLYVLHVMYVILETCDSR